MARRIVKSSITTGKHIFISNRIIEAGIATKKTIVETLGIMIARSTAEKTVVGAQVCVPSQIRTDGIKAGRPAKKTIIIGKLDLGARVMAKKAIVIGTRQRRVTS